MTDIVVTVPRDRWPHFVAGYGRSGQPASWQFCQNQPPLTVGDWLFMAAHGRIRCAIAISQIARRGPCLIAAGSLRAGITIEEKVAGFPGWRRAWFSMRAVIEFPDWRSKGVWYPPKSAPPADTAALPAYAHGKTRAEQGGCS
jgi:hypothetical protein